MFGWLRKKFGKRVPRVAVNAPRYDWEREWDHIGVLRAKYDSAQTVNENRRHWANADSLSPNAANSIEVRRTLRNRARYEVANNPHARNILLSLANYTIGRGPRLQMRTESSELNRVLEAEFNRWLWSVDIGSKLRTMRAAKVQDGEAFALFTNRKTSTPVALDLRLIEADQVASLNYSIANLLDRGNPDGIVLDEYGLPVAYEILSKHPGDTGFAMLDSRLVDAKYVLHYTRQDRPGQVRGVPEITSALPLFALLRRYVLAVLTAAESAASFAAVMKTVMPPMGDDQGNGFGQAASVPAGMSIEIERNMITSLPEGWDISQLRAEQPTATFEAFHDKILNDIGTVLSVPFNVVACNSSGYNYASGRMDYQGFDLSLNVERSAIERSILDPVLQMWRDEAVMVEGYLPQPARGRSIDWAHQWFWDGREHVDPVKEANAQKTKLANGTTTLAQEYAKRGLDYEAEIEQWSREVWQKVSTLIAQGFTREEALRIAVKEAAGASVPVESSGE